MSDSSPNKRVEEIPIDRLGSLPDGLLIHVLSFLGVKEAAVTSVLSKRWKLLWSQLPKLEFCENSDNIEKIRQFVSMVNRTLLIRGGVHLEKLWVSLSFDESLTPEVDYWVGFVLQNKTKEFGLQLIGKEEDVLYELPDSMYSNSSLTRLSLRGCFMDSARSIEWRSLTYLFVEHTELPQQVIQNILSCCPVLHTLSLWECWGFDCFEVKSRCLHHLKVKDREDGRNGPLLKISAPYVQELDIVLFLQGRTLQLRKMTSLVKARINFDDFCVPNEEELMNATKEIFEIIQHVKDLHLGPHYFKAISELVVSGWKIPVSRRTCLSILTFNEDEPNITGIIALLESSPNLEKFVIDGYEPGGEVWDETAKGDLDCDLLHLKSVKFIQFAVPVFGGEPMLTVARALLKRAPVLEEMEVVLRSREISDYVKIGQTLLTYPRSSGKAVIRLY